MVDWSVQRRWEDVEAGQELSPVDFPITLYRLVMAAAATRDFNSIHHNPEFARETNAPDAYANTMFLLSMWERAVREFIGLAGQLRALTGMRMRTFNVAGSTVTVRGVVRRTWLDRAEGFAEIEIWSQTGPAITVGPGSATVTLPQRETDLPIVRRKISGLAGSGWVAVPSALPSDRQLSRRDGRDH
jgi:acyl dehydratase